MAFEITPLSIEGMLKEVETTSTLYVTNNSGWRFDTELRKEIKQTLGIVHVTYRNTGNELTSIAVPATWVPINLAEYGSPRLIMESENFRNLVRKNLLVGISKTDADRIRSSPEARKELQAHATKAGVVGANGRIQEAMTSFVVGPSTQTDDTDVNGSNESFEALETLLNEFNTGKVTDSIATERFKNLRVSMTDITSNLSQMAATDSQLFGAMLERMEQLEGSDSNNATFPA